MGKIKELIEISRVKKKSFFGRICCTPEDFYIFSESELTELLKEVAGEQTKIIKELHVF